MFQYLQLHDFEKYKASALALIAANVLLLFGVLFLGWDTLSIVALYWVENLIIGGVNVLKMLVASPDPNAFKLSDFLTPQQQKELEKQGQDLGPLEKSLKAHHASKLFLVPFFAFHYGFFCLIHGIFVFALFGREANIGGHVMTHGPFGALEAFADFATETHLWWCVFALAASHLWSFVVNFIGRGEYKRTAVPILMAQPYARVVVLHIAIILGGFVTMAFGSPMGLLIILVIGKTILDLNLHLRERDRNERQAADQPPILPEVLTKPSD